VVLKGFLDFGAIRKMEVDIVDYITVDRVVVMLLPYIVEAFELLLLLLWHAGF